MDECERIIEALLAELASIAPAALACLVVLVVVDAVLIVRVGLDSRTEARDGEPLEEWAKRDIARAGARTADDPRDGDTPRSLR